MPLESIYEDEQSKALALGSSSGAIYTEHSQIHSSKLLTLLKMTWDSPVFGDAFPFSHTLGQEKALELVFEKIESMHTLLIEWLKPILNEWMHPISIGVINEIVRQIAPKSTAFCSAIAVNEIDDIELLAQVGLSIALVYWIDHRMDRGDYAMEEAIKWRQKYPKAVWHDDQIHLPEASNVQACLLGIQALEQSVHSFSSPDDAEVLIAHVLDEVLVREARISELSRLYKQYDPTLFWSKYKQELAEHTILDGALLYVTGGIYAIHRLDHPELPDLKQVFANPAVMRLINGPAAAMIRVIDDLGDSEIDSGNYPAWGQFTLNIFNQPHPAWISVFLNYSGFTNPTTIQSLILAFQDDTEVNHKYIVDTFVNFVRSEFSAMDLQDYYNNELFLNIAKRVIEAGYVNAIGDMALAE